MSKRLEGKVAIVTGAGCIGPGWGNGRAAAVIFAQEGAKVFAVDNNVASMDETLERARAADGTIEPYCCDVTDSRQVAAMVKACAQKFGRVDILVNNVGGSAPGGPVELSEQDWDRQIDYNLKSIFLTCKAVLPVMATQGGGAVVNTASTSGIRWTGSAQVGYASAKAGVDCNPGISNRMPPGRLSSALTKPRGSEAALTISPDAPPRAPRPKRLRATRAACESRAIGFPSRGRGRMMRADHIAARHENTAKVRCLS